MRRIRHILVVALALAPALAHAGDDEQPATVLRGKTFKLRSEDGKSSLGISGRLQFRWDAEYKRGSGSGSELTDRFSLPAARFTFDGNIHGDLEYKLQLDVGKGDPALKDYFLEKPIAGGGKITVRAGQFKKPFSRQQITSSGSLQMLTRSISDKFSGSGRDLGVMVSNRFEKSPEGLEWALGVFNGTGEAGAITCPVPAAGSTATSVTCARSNIPGDIGPQAALRVGYNKGKIKGYSESDLEGGPLRIAVAASYLIDFKDFKSEAFEHRVGIDFAVKKCGFSATGAAYVVDKSDADGSFDFAKQYAAFGQVGFFLVPSKYEFTARVSRNPQLGSAAAPQNQNQLEILAGFNWFGAGHAWKLQTQAGVIHDTGDAGGTDKVIGAQAQVVF